MPTSITISDQLRKKIKKMAALLDTSQAEIIARAIDEYEKKFTPSEVFTDPEVIIKMKNSSEKIYLKYPERKKRSQRLMQSHDILDSIAPAIWGKDVND